MRRTQMITLSLPKDAKKRLEKIALLHGCFWGEKPSISALLAKIASGELIAIGAKTDMPKSFC